MPLPPIPAVVICRGSSYAELLWILSVESLVSAALANFRFLWCSPIDSLMYKVSEVLQISRMEMQTNRILLFSLKRQHFGMEVQSSLFLASYPQYPGLQ